MPFRSENQRRFMWAKHPDIARKWAHGEHSTSGSGHKMPENVKEAAKRRLGKLRGENGS